MRRLTVAAVALSALLAIPPVSASAASELSALRSVFANGLNAAGGTNGAAVVDLSTNKSLYAYKQSIGRVPASVEKLYTTATTLLRFGPSARFQTTIFGTGGLDSTGDWHGTLYLRGTGDPTFGSRNFDTFAYGAGANMQQLVDQLVHGVGISSVSGRVMGDESYFDALRGTAPYGYQVATDVGGPLSALEYDRGLADEQGTAFQLQPALFAAQKFVAALRAAGTRVPTGIYGTAKTPARAIKLASVGSPTIASLIRMTNVPSDNLFAEMLLKGLGARFGAGGSSSAGAAVVRAQLARFGVHPRVTDGSGLSRGDVTSPIQVVTLLRQMAGNTYFTNALAVAGQTGTLASRMRGTAADGRCRAKTGTLRDASALAGYCLARNGHTLAFAILQNSIDPTAAHPVQDAMAIALARYNG
jgi:D-alanyl-D-alanine carboxypeptidase/D-alanyl-D-alanine-endopeptidase (penicillin-binding protein 4)